MTIETSKASKAALDDSDQLSAQRPPPYVGHPIASASNAQSDTYGGVRAGNFVLVSKKYDAVKGTFAIDPTIEMPVHTLPPLDSPSTVASSWSFLSSILSPKEEISSSFRPNLLLKSIHGLVEAKVHVVVTSVASEATQPLRTTVKARSSWGSVTLQVHRHESTTSAVHIDASSIHGAIVVSLPRSFQGPLKLSSRWGSMKRSPGITSAGWLFYEKEHTQHAFIGDQAAWSADPEGWAGDEAVLQSHYGSVTVRFLDEPDEWTQFLLGVKGFMGMLPQTSG